MKNSHSKLDALSRFCFNAPKPNNCLDCRKVPTLNEKFLIQARCFISVLFQCTQTEQLPRLSKSPNFKEKFPNQARSLNPVLFPCRQMEQLPRLSKSPNFK